MTLDEHKHPESWGPDPKSRSTLGFHNLQHRSIRAQNWGIYFLDPPGGLGITYALSQRENRKLCWIPELVLMYKFELFIPLENRGSGLVESKLRRSLAIFFVPYPEGPTREPDPQTHTINGF